MALTTTLIRPGRRMGPGESTNRVVDITFDSSYPTGGEAIAPADVFLQVIFSIVDVGHVAGTLIHSVRHDPAAGKLLAYDSAGAQIANATNLSAETVRVHAVGR